MQLYNTLTRTKETFKPITKGKVNLYTCGPTIYNFAHIGNYRAYIFEDILRRFLKYKGYTVNQIMNITDVDDKTIKGANDNNVTLQEFTDQYAKAFFEDLDTLSIERAEQYPVATAYINEMVEIIKSLLEKKIAYKGDDNSIYFSLKKFKNYGKLSKIDKNNLKEGARVAHDEYDKETASDFALWKAWDKEDGDIFWETELGKGRPGWHIECSAMSMKLLGNHFDIHTGGVDNIFPHHENEIAQSEGSTGETFVNYWLHCEHLLVDNKKMSKSLGNFYTLRDLLDKGYSGRQIRFVLLASHYRVKLNFTIEGIESAKNTLDRFDDFMRNLQHSQGDDNSKVNKITEKAKKEFEKALDDDLNMPNALAAIFDFMRDINKLDFSQKDAENIKNTMLDFNKILGVIEIPDDTIDPHIQQLINEREEARKNKDFKKADEIRKNLKKQGIILEDNDQGVTWKKK